MEQLIEILANCCPTVDFANETKLVTNKLIDSVDLVSIISDIEDAFDVSIDMEVVTPENFDSADSIWALIESLK